MPRPTIIHRASASVSVAAGGGLLLVRAAAALVRTQARGATCNRLGACGRSLRMAGFEGGRVGVAARSRRQGAAGARRQDLGACDKACCTECSVPPASAIALLATPGMQSTASEIRIERSPAARAPSKNRLCTTHHKTRSRARQLPLNFAYLPDAYTGRASDLRDAASLLKARTARLASRFSAAVRSRWCIHG